MSGFSGFALKGKKKRKLLQPVGSTGDDDDGGGKKKERIAPAGEDGIIPRQQDTFVPGMGDRRFNSERYLPEGAEGSGGDSLKELQEGEAKAVSTFFKDMVTILKETLALA